MKRFALAFAIAFAATGFAHAQTANGRATTNPPTYADNTAAPLSLDLDGNLRVDCVQGCSGGGGGGTSSNFGAAFPATGTAIGGIGFGGNMSGITAAPNGLITSLSVVPGSSAVAAMDAVANSTSTFQSSYGPSGVTTTAYMWTRNFVFNGTTWDRMRGDTNGLWISQGPFLTDAQLRASPVPVSGTVAVTGPLTDTQLRAAPVETINPASFNFSAIGTAGTNSVLISPTPATVTEISVYNIGTANAWLKLYNAAVAPTCGAGTPVARYLIPAEGGSNIPVASGKTFTTGLGYCITTGIADNDTGAIPANEVTVNFSVRG